jgi:NAD+ kinase
MSQDLPIAIACRLDKSDALDLTRKIVEYFLEKNVKISLENRIAQRFQPHLRKDLRHMDEKSVKMIISIGGDGTLLRVCQNLPRNPAPLFGINIGSVGFLDEFDNSPESEDLLYKVLDRIIAGDYYIESSMRLNAVCNRKRLQNALNEVYVVSSKPSKVLHVGIKIDGALLNTAYLDGVLISTQAGSTAYSLSAGGSLIDPRLRVIQIVPVNPFARTGGINPIIIPSTSEVEIELLRPKLNALVIIDGQQEYHAFPRSIIKVRNAESNIKFVRLKKDFKSLYYEKLRAKILTGVKIPREDSPEE